MARDLENEVKALRRDLEISFKIAWPTYQFKATMILAYLQLLVNIELFKNSHDPKERRQLINEFEKQKESIQKGIRMLFESPRVRKPNLLSSRALP